MRIHALTACSRPENLTKVGLSLAHAARGHDVHWHVRFDLEREHVGGQAVKNRLLDEISDGWVWILDDDTIVHPDLFSRAAECAALTGIEAIVVSQRRE